MIDDDRTPESGAPPGADADAATPAAGSARIVRLARRPAGEHAPAPPSESEAALGRQLLAMSALLLFNEGVAGDRPYEELLERLSAQLPTILDSRLVALLVADPDEGRRVSLYFATAESGSVSRAERHPLDAVPLQKLRDGGGTAAWVELLDRLPPHVRESLARVPPARLKVTPVGHRDRLLGLLIACTVDDPTSQRAGWAWHQVVARNVATATHRVRRNRELVRRAYFDTLTGLPNRALFQDRLQQAVARARRTGRRLAVLYLDLDDFKWVNDTLGHHAGDELLRRVATLLGSALRETDTVARLAGDEFAVVLPDVGDARQIDKVLATLRARLQTPAEVAGHTLALRASIGVAVFPVHGADADALVRSADAAMYRVKRARAAKRAAPLLGPAPAAERDANAADDSARRRSASD